MISETDSIYQIFLRNFTKEGTFRAAIPHLSRIASMGFTWVYLTPIHPIGTVARKGTLGSPYAIKDYKAINAELGTFEDFDAFVKAAHASNLKVMIDVVYNHTSPDSVLWQEHPEWFLQGPDGRPGRKCEDWSDVIDFDYSSSPHLWAELIDTLAMWRDRGVDGFRCDVASLVPAEFWKQARMRVNQYDPGGRKELRPLVWLAESVHPAFLRSMRNKGYGAWSEPELHAAAFDLTYDYDGWERLETDQGNKEGKTSILKFFEHLYAQETLYPKGAKKLRFIENHDQERAAHRLGKGDLLRAWTVLYQFLPGVTLAYMGQELALDHRPNLFDRDPIDPAKGDPYFEQFFVSSLKATTEAKQQAPYFSWSIFDDNVVFCLRSTSPANKVTPIEEAMVKNGNYLLIAGAGLNHHSERKARLLAPFDIQGTDLLTGEAVNYPSGSEIPSSPAFLVRLGN